MKIFNDRMNNKEAIEILKVYKQKLENSCSNQLDKDIEAFDLAIKTLEFTDEYCPKTFNNYLKGKQILARREKE